MIEARQISAPENPPLVFRTSPHTPIGGGGAERIYRTFRTFPHLTFASAEWKLCETKKSGKGPPNKSATTPNFSRRSRSRMPFSVRSARDAAKKFGVT